VSFPSVSNRYRLKTRVKCSTSHCRFGRLLLLLFSVLSVRTYNVIENYERQLWAAASRTKIKKNPLQTLQNEFLRMSPKKPLGSCETSGCTGLPCPCRRGTDSKNFRDGLKQKRKEHFASESAKTPPNPL